MIGFWNVRLKDIKADIKRTFVRKSDWIAAEKWPTVAA
jgi:hypothetical protein